MDIGRYRIVDEIARGGMGVVFRAQDPATAQQVAIKVMLGPGFSNPTSQRRFVREAEALSRVRHPAVVRLLGHDTTRTGAPYIVMELAEGDSLQARLDRDGPLDPDDAARIVATLADAVGAAHAANVLHRDLKPSNVILAPDGTLRLTDFGLARDVDPSMSRTALSVEGNFLGSPGFWSPEQAGGRVDQVGVQTDVYGLGATLFALLTAQDPHQGETLMEILSAVAARKPRASSLNRDVPRWLDAVVERALAVDPADRFATAADLADALRGGPAAQGSAGVPPLGVIAAGIVVLIGAGTLLALRGAPASPTNSPVKFPSAVRPPPVTAPTAEVSEADALIARGLSIYERTPATAEALFSRALVLAPASANAHRGRAGARGRLGQKEQALRDYAEAIRLAPADARNLLKRGAYYCHLKRWADALPDFDRAIELDPELATAYHYRGIAHHRLDNITRALADFGEAIRLDPTVAGAYADRGALLPDKRQARKDLDTAIRLAPDSAQAYFHRGKLREAENDPRGAIEDYGAVIRHDPNGSLAYFRRAVVRGTLTNWQGAIEDLTHLLRIKPKHANAYRLRGEAHSQLGDDASALVDFDALVRLRPKEPLSYRVRGVTLGRLGRHQESLRDFSAELARDPTSEPALFNRGIAYFKLREWQRAVDDWERLAKLDRNYPRLAENLRAGRAMLAKEKAR